MEGFEHVVRGALEVENYIVQGNLKFPVKRATKQRTKQGKAVEQTHGYEIDLVGARGDSLVLASVKSFFGSHGVSKVGFRAIADKNDPKEQGLYRIINDEDLRDDIIDAAAKRFGYEPRQVEIRLYVGRFKPGHEDSIRAYVSSIRAGIGPIRVFGIKEIVQPLLKLAESTMYIDDPVAATVKALREAGCL